MKIQISHDDGRTWINLKRYDVALKMARIGSGARFLAWLNAGYVVIKGASQYRIAPKGASGD